MNDTQLLNLLETLRGTSELTFEKTTDVYHPVEKTRVVDFVATLPNTNTHLLERLLLLDWDASTFTTDIIEGCFVSEASPTGGDSQLEPDTVEYAAEDVHLDWKNKIVRCSSENVTLFNSRHSHTNRRALHSNEEHATCSAPNTGSVALVHAKNSEDIYHRFLCLCKHEMNGMYKFGENSQNISLVTSHATVPVLPSLPKNDSGLFDPLKAAGNPSLAMWIMRKRSEVTCLQNGIFRWLDGYLYPDASNIVTSSGYIQPLLKSLDVCEEKFSPQCLNYCMLENPVVNMAYSVRAAVGNEDSVNSILYKVAKEVRWNFLLLSLAKSHEFFTAVSNAKDELAKMSIYLKDKDESPILVQEDEYFGWQHLFTTLLNPLLNRSLEISPGSVIENLNWRQGHALMLFMYATYGGNPKGVSEAISLLESIALKNIASGSPDIKHRRKVAKAYFDGGILQGAVSDIILGVDHLGSARAVRIKELPTTVKKEGILCGIAGKHVSIVTLTKEKQSSITFKLDGAKYKATVTLRQLLIKRIGAVRRTKGQLYRITGLTILGSRVTFAEVKQDEENVGSLANLMLSGACGYDAADWLFRKLIYGEVTVSNQSMVSYIPEQCMSSSEQFPMITAELLGDLLAGHSVLLSKRGLIIATEDCAPDILIRKDILHYTCEFLSGSRYENKLNQAEYFRGVIMHNVPLGS